MLWWLPHCKNREAGCKWEVGSAGNEAICRSPPPTSRLKVILQRPELSCGACSSSSLFSLTKSHPNFLPPPASHSAPLSVSSHPFRNLRRSSPQPPRQRQLWVPTALVFAGHLTAPVSQAHFFPHSGAAQTRGPRHEAQDNKTLTFPEEFDSVAPSIRVRLSERPQPCVTRRGRCCSSLRQA